MTDDEKKADELAWQLKGKASAEARRRWGNGGAAWEGRLSIDNGRGPFRVGVWTARGETIAYGTGKSWEQAFLDADMRHPSQQEAAQ